MKKGGIVVVFNLQKSIKKKGRNVGRHLYPLAGRESTCCKVSKSKKGGRERSGRSIQLMHTLRLPRLHPSPSLLQKLIGVELNLSMPHQLTYYSLLTTTPLILVMGGSLFMYGRSPTNIPEMIGSLLPGELPCKLIFLVGFVPHTANRVFFHQPCF